MDTSNDYRILIAEVAIKNLQDIIRNRRLPFSIRRDEILKKIKNIQSKLMVIKYSFLSNDILISSQQFKDFLEHVNSLADELMPKINNLEYSNNYIIVWIKWIIRTLLGLQFRLLLSGNYPDYAVDILGVRINSVIIHESIRNLNVLRVSTDEEGFTVVTNISNIKRGEVRAVAILPPKEFKDIISEAMVCSQPLSEKYYGIRPEREKYNFKEVINMVEDYLFRHK